MKNKLLLILPALLLCSCGGASLSSTSEKISQDSQSNSESTSNKTTSETTSNTTSNTTSETTSISGDKEDIIIESDLYETFWDESANISFNLSFTNDSLYYLSEYGKDGNSGKSEIYFPADLTISFDGITYFYKDVGARTKGNTSRDVLFDNKTYNNRKIHYKLSFQETFDDEEIYTGELANFFVDWTGKEAERATRKDRTLVGMEKLDIKYNRSYCYDPTFLRQVYGYSLYRNANLMAPNAGLASLRISHNGSTLYKDTYQMIEVIDKVFLKRHFSSSEAKGDLYKLGWTNTGANFLKDGAIKESGGSYTYGNLIGVEDKASGKFYPYDLKTNKKTSTHQALVNFIKILNETYESDSSNYYLNIESVLDLDYFGKMEAIAFLIGSPDDVRNNWNNAYIYFNPINNKAYLIPYDIDQCLGFKSDVMDSFWPTTTKYQGYQRINNGDKYMDMPLYWKTLLVNDNSSTGAQYSTKFPSSEVSKSSYKATLSKYLANDSYFTESVFNNYISKFPLCLSTTSGNDKFETIGNYISAKKDAISSDARLKEYII